MEKGRKIFFAVSIIIIIIITILVVLVINNASTNTNVNLSVENSAKEKSDFWRNNYDFGTETKDYNIVFEHIKGKITWDKLRKQYNFGDNDFSEIIKAGEYKFYYLNEDKYLVFNIDNCSQTDLTVEQCIKNGWWHITDSEVYPSDLGSNISEQNNISYNFNFEETDLLEETLKKLGEPTYIYMREYTVSDYESQIYSIIYEYEDLAFVIDVVELLMDEKTKSSLTIPHITYFTRDSWEYGKLNYINSTKVYENSK